MSQTIWGIELFEQGKMKEEQKGRLEGEQAGKLKGEAVILQRQLERRFGALPTWALERIQQANESQLETWSVRVLEMSELESILS